MSRTGRIQLDKHTRGMILAGKVTRLVRVPTRTRFTTGDICPIMPEAGPASFRVVVTEAVWTFLPDAIPAGDVITARQLGHRTSLDAQRAFLVRNHPPFRRLPETDRAELNDHAITKAWATWADRRCWSLSIQPHTSLEERFMARSPHATAEKVVTPEGYRIHKQAADNLARGYTTDSRLAVEGEGACVDDVTLARYAEEARAKHTPAHTFDADARDEFVIRQRLAKMRARRAA